MSVCVYDRRLVHVKPLFKMYEGTSLHCFLHWLFLVNTWLCLCFWREIFNFDIYMVNLYAHSPLGGGSAQRGKKMTHHSKHYVVAALCFCDTYTWYPDNCNTFFSVTLLLKMCQVTFLTGRQLMAGLQREAQMIVCTHLHTSGQFRVAS